MLQQNRKDYLQRLIEELFQKLQKLLDTSGETDAETKKMTLNASFQFFFDNFEITPEDNASVLLTKMDSCEFSEDYARILLMQYKLTNGVENQLEKAFEIIEYIDEVDNTYSWQRTILKQDILRLLSNS